VNARGRTQFAPTSKRTEIFSLCPFSHALLAMYSVLHLLGILSGGNIASSYGRGGGRRLTERVIFSPLTRYRGSSPIGRAFDLCVPNARLLFTAFLDAKAKPRTRRGKKTYFAYCFNLSIIEMKRGSWRMQSYLLFCILPNL